jgi:hypothetical protein
MAALKRNGEEDWKKRNIVSAATNNTNNDQSTTSVNEQPSNSSSSTSSISLIKQQQQQLKLQNLSGIKPIQNKMLVNELQNKRTPLNDNTNNIDNNINNATSTTIEDENLNNKKIDNLEAPLFVENKKKLPIGARIIFNPSDLNADLGKKTLSLF